MITNPRVAAERLSVITKDSVETEVNEIIRLALKSKMDKLTQDEFKYQLTKITNEIIETSSQELENIGIELSQFHIQLN